MDDRSSLNSLASRAATADSRPVEDRSAPDRRFPSPARSVRALLSSFALLAFVSTISAAQPIVVPTGDGQIGIAPGIDDRIAGSRFEPIRGEPGDLLLGGFTDFGGAMPPPPALDFVVDQFHEIASPFEVLSLTGSFDFVQPQPPSSARRPSGEGDDEVAVFTYVVDGSQPQTITVRATTFDGSGVPLVTVDVAGDVQSFFAFDLAFVRTGVTVDDQGRATVTYTEFDESGFPTVRASRIDAVTGTVIDPPFTVNPNIVANSDAALLDPSGDRLVVVGTDFGVNPPVPVANLVDFSGPTPVVLPEFPVASTMPGIVAQRPVVAADPTTGLFQVVWEDFTDLPGDPVNVRARRFDADGNPLGDDFLVNTNTADAQGQAAVAMASTGEAVVIWAGDPSTPTGPENLDIFGQAYDAAGSPIGGEFPVTGPTDAVQDRPTVRFLPEPDALGQQQFAVVWRDVENSDGSGANGTGTSFRCFSIGEDPTEIFADGFESGDTTSWSDSSP